MTEQTQTIDLEPNWPAVRAFVREVYKTDPEAAERIAATMGREAPDLRSGCEACGKPSSGRYCAACMIGIKPEEQGDGEAA